MTALQLFILTPLPVAGMCDALLGALKLPLVDRLAIDAGMRRSYEFMTKMNLEVAAR